MKAAYARSALSPLLNELERANCAEIEAAMEQLQRWMVVACGRHECRKLAPPYAPTVATDGWTVWQLVPLP